MDQIFLRNPSVLVCGNNEMTQRARPQALIDSETERIARGDGDVDGSGLDSGPRAATMVV